MKSLLIAFMSVVLFSAPGSAAGASSSSATLEFSGVTWLVRDFRNANSGAPSNWYQALAFVHEANEKKLGGFSNWRLPSPDELAALMERGGLCEGFDDVPLGLPESFTGAGSVAWTSEVTGSGRVAALDLSTWGEKHRLELSPEYGSVEMTALLVRSDDDPVIRRIESASARFLQRRALAARGAGRLADALAAARGILAIEPRNIEAWNEIAKSYRSAEDWKNAHATWDRAIALYPDAPRLYLLKGYALEAHGDSHGAVALYRKSCEVDPLFADGWRYLGDLAFQSCDYAEAAAHYGECLKRDPESFKAALMRSASTLR